MSVRLNASGDILYRTANLPGFSAYTIAGWFYRVNAQASTFVYFMGLENTAYPSDSSQYNLIGLNNGGTLEIVNSGASTTFSATPATGTWFYAYIRGNGTNLQGGWAAATAASFTTASQGQGNTFTPATLGVGADTFDEFLDGRAAYVRAWDAFLTDAELLSEMRSPVPVRFTNLNFAWRLATATDTADKTSNARAATVGGSITVEDGPPIRGFARRGQLQVPLAAAGGGGGGTTTSKTMTDTLTFSEELVRWNRRNRQQNEALTIFDDPNRVIDMQVSDLGLDMTDEETDFAVRGRVSSDAVSMTDGFVQWRRFRRQSDDTLDVLDGFIKSVLGSGTLYTKVMSEAIELADGFVRWVRYRRTTDDMLDIVDAFSKLIAGAGIQYARVMSDAVTMIDDTGNRWTFRRNLMTDTLQIPDELVRGAVRGRVLNDALAFTDALTKWTRLVRQLGEDVEFSDGTVRVRQHVRIHEDFADLTDELIRSLFLDQLQPTNFILGSGSEPFRFGTGTLPFN
jgi:hypothetical protein